MDERLPHGDEAIVDRAKIEAYCLNEAHSAATRPACFVRRWVSGNRTPHG